MTAQQTARNVLVAIIVVATVYVLWLLREVLLLAVLALFVAVALSGPVGYLTRRLRLPRALAILLVYACLAGLIALLGLLVLPPLVRECEELLRAIPAYIRDLADEGVFQRWDKEYGIVDKLQGEAGKLPGVLEGALGELEAITIGAIERVVEMIAILAVAFLLLLDAPRVLEFVYRQLPPEREERARKLAADTARAVSGYVAGVFAVAALAGVVSFLVMLILGIPFAVPLAVVMAFFALLPLVGSSIGAVVIAFVAAFEGLGIVLAWAGFWVVYQQTETHVLGPLVYRRAVDLRPVFVILSVLAGATLMGILGALLAIPAAATIQILVREWWQMREESRVAAAAPEPAGPV
jgi:predicted PurR-regulated permease PerM